MGLYDRDYGRDERTPWDRAQNPRSITITLIIINVVVFIAGLLFYGTGEDGSRKYFVEDWLAVDGNTLLRPWMWWQFLTYGFVHDMQSSMPTHLIFNMIGLYVFGRDVELRLGRMEFLRFYLVSIILGGIVGAITSFAFGGPGTIGASGGVIAAVVLFACYFPNREILLMLVLPVKAWVLAVIFVCADLAGALGITGTDSNTAFTVHLAGAAFALAYYYGAWNLRWLAFDAVTDIPARMRQRSRRMKLKLHDPDRKLQKDADDADRILAKIHEQGESSLTSAERKTLERYSRRQREKRDR